MTEIQYSSASTDDADDDYADDGDDDDDDKNYDDDDLNGTRDGNADTDSDGEYRPPSRPRHKRHRDDSAGEELPPAKIPNPRASKDESRVTKLKIDKKRLSIVLEPSSPKAREPIPAYAQPQDTPVEVLCNDSHVIRIRSLSASQ